MCNASKIWPLPNHPANTLMHLYLQSRTLYSFHNRPCLLCLHAFAWAGVCKGCPCLTFPVRSMLQFFFKSWHKFQIFLEMSPSPSNKWNRSPQFSMPWDCVLIIALITNIVNNLFPLDGKFLVVIKADWLLHKSQWLNTIGLFQSPSQSRSVWWVERGGEGNLLHIDF